MRQRIIPGVVHSGNTTTLSETESAHDALQAMEAHGVGAVCVCDADGHLKGIVSERDVMRHILGAAAPAQGKTTPGKITPGKTTPLREIMVQNPEPLRADDDALDAMELMIARNIRYLPVVSPENRVIAMVSMRDLLENALKTLNETLTRAREKAFAPEIK